MQAHLSIGVLIFALTVMRLVWRILLPCPPAPSGMRRSTLIAARGMRICLYLLLLSLPVSGYVKLAALEYDATIFGVITLPALPFDPDLANLARRTHALFAIILSLLVVVHVAAAIWHRRLFGSSVLLRMSLLRPNL